MRKETGSGDVLARFVRFDAVGRCYVVGDRSEEVGVGESASVDFDDPFEAVSGGASECERRGEVAVFEKKLLERVNIGEMVEVEAEESAGGFDAAVGTDAEFSAEGDVGETGLLVECRFLLVWD